MAKKIEHTPSSGNVFADLGLANADELLAKAEMAVKIARLQESKTLAQEKRAPRERARVVSRARRRNSS